VTAEVAILNSSAVALAADSAVTINTSNGETKIFNSVEKLFRISETQPIAFMVYGNGSFAGTSWELIAKQFRAENEETQFEKVDDCVLSFLAFIKDRKDIISSETREDFTITNIELFIKSILDVVFESASSKNLDKNETKSAINQEFITNKTFLENCDFRIGLSADNEIEIKKYISEKVDQLSKKYFEELLDEPLSELILETSSLYLTRCHGAMTSSGLVFAGFGNSEFKPVVESFDFFGALADEIFVQKNENLCHKKTNSVSVIPFAQGDVIQSFIRGISPTAQTSIESHSRALIFDILEQFVESSPELFNQPNSTLRSDLANQIEIKRQEFLENISQSAIEKLVNPIIGMLQYLPKDELATMAEALVNMTAFRRKVSHDNETVGGPIDVAVLSKNDGFVWIKRKHYFPKEMNDHFFKNRG
jgi:hypothetical protein